MGPVESPSAAELRDVLSGLGIAEDAAAPVASWGLPSLDAVTGGGIHPGLTFVGGPTATGKTSLLMQAWLNACLRASRERTPEEWRDEAARYLLAPFFETELDRGTMDFRLLCQAANLRAMEREWGRAAMVTPGELRNLDALSPAQLAAVQAGAADLSRLNREGRRIACGSDEFSDFRDEISWCRKFEIAPGIPPVYGDKARREGTILLPADDVPSLEYDYPYVNRKDELCTLEPYPEEPGMYAFYKAPRISGAVPPVRAKQREAGAVAFLDYVQDLKDTAGEEWDASAGAAAGAVGALSAIVRDESRFAIVAASTEKTAAGGAAPSAAGFGETQRIGYKADTLVMLRPNAERGVLALDVIAIDAHVVKARHGRAGAVVPLWFDHPHKLFIDPCQARQT